MYKQGDLRISPDCPRWRVDEYDCLHEGDHPRDARGNYEPLIGGVSLPHSCDSWVIGGPAEILALMADLNVALTQLQKKKP